MSESKLNQETMNNLIKLSKKIGIEEKQRSKVLKQLIQNKRDGFVREIISKPKMYVIGGSEAFEKVSRYQLAGDST